MNTQQRWYFCTRHQTVEPEDGGAALFCWTRATGATSPQTDVFPFSRLCPNFDPGSDAFPDALSSRAGG